MFYNLLRIPIVVLWAISGYLLFAILGSFHVVPTNRIEVAAVFILLGVGTGSFLALRSKRAVLGTTIAALVLVVLFIAAFSATYGSQFTKIW